MDCSDCDSSGLDSPNSSWSIARLKENLRKKTRPSKRGKDELLEWDYLHRHRPLACTLRVGRSIGGSCTNFTSLALQPLAINIPPAFDRKWFLHLVNRSQLHAFSQGRAFLCFVVRAHSIGDRRRETCAAKLQVQKKKPMALHMLSGSNQPSLLCHDC